MGRGKKFIAGVLATALAGSICMPAAFAEGPIPGEQYTENGEYYYEPLEQGVYSDGGYIIEKVSHPDRGAGELDSIIDPEERGQSYS